MDSEAARARLFAHLSSEIKDRRVLDAMARVPRERFIPADGQHLAFEDIPLPIGYGQTISQPLIIAMMTEALKLNSSEKVLEVGTGSGYQAAILAELARRVVSTERIPALADQARRVLDNLGYTNVIIHLAGETLGYSPEAPYDAIMVTAAAPRVPEPLLKQLAIGGRMVVPVGPRHVQELYSITKGERDNIVQNLGGCRFVPLVGKDAWREG